MVSGSEIFLPLVGMVDAAMERARLEKELQEALLQIERLENLLNSPFAQKAPAPVVEKEKDKLADFRQTADKLKEQIRNLR